jgi:hypothetical protein
LQVSAINALSARKVFHHDTGAGGAKAGKLLGVSYRLRNLRPIDPPVTQRCKEVFSGRGKQVQRLHPAPRSVLFHLLDQTLSAAASPSGLIDGQRAKQAKLAIELDPNNASGVGFLAAAKEVLEVLVLEIGTRKLAGGEQLLDFSCRRMRVYAHAPDLLAD